MRVDPHDGESWLGYTRRVAAQYDVSWTALMAPVLTQDNPCAAPGLTYRDTGTAAAPETVIELARYFGLDPAEVDIMHASRYLEPIAAWPATDLQRVDPLISRRDEGVAAIRQAERGPFRSHLTSPLVRRECLGCREDTPLVDSLLWRFDWYVACSTHGRLLVDTVDQPHDAPATRETLDAQATLTRLLDTSAAHGASRREIMGLLDALTVQAGHQLHLIAGVTRMASVLTQLRSTLDGGPDGDLMRLLARTSPHDALMAFATYVPDTVTIRRLAPGTLPRVLPEVIYVPDLSDLLYPLPVNQGRLLTGEILRLGAREAAPDQAFLPDLPGQEANEMVERLAALHDHGRIDRFWWAMNDAARRLRTENGSDRTLIRPQVRQTA